MKIRISSFYTILIWCIRLRGTSEAAGSSDGARDGGGVVGISICGTVHIEDDELGALEVSIGWTLTVGFEIALEDLKLMISWHLYSGLKLA